MRRNLEEVREQLFHFLADEFDQDGDRELYSLGGDHLSGDLIFVVKKP